MSVAMKSFEESVHETQSTLMSAKVRTLSEAQILDIVASAHIVLMDQPNAQLTDEVVSKVAEFTTATCDTKYTNEQVRIALETAIENNWLWSGIKH
ncbi:MAG TPA: hypothetical protein V6C81_12555 [Planktothrix sp.]|jgi:hypothetical protein